MAKQKSVLPSTIARVMSALEQTGGHQKQAAKLLGISSRRLQTIIQTMRENDQYVPNSPHSLIQHWRPDRARITGTSTLVGADGETKLQWIKESATAPTPEEFAEVVKAAFGEITPIARIPKNPERKTLPHLLAVYPMGDPHIGMYAWGEESGEDFDLNIAERNLVAATGHLVACCPSAEQALIVNVGDFFHADNTENKTLRSGNVLDVDTRWAKVLRVGIRTMRSCIENALARHKRVHVINEIGNHDDHSSQMLTIALAMFYENNPRVTFDESPARYHYFRFGKNLIGVTHGDTVKPEALGPIMATDRAKDWGETEFRYWYTGHIHTRKVFELPGVITESFRTLAARDAWTAGSGYRAGRDMTAIVLDKDYGEVERHRIDIAMLNGLFS